MSNKIGHFEILSELVKSATGAVYKANDPATTQTVALKAIRLPAFGARAADLEKCLLQEAEASKILSNPNLTVVYGAGVIDGQFCAAMEYIQGNSVATMLARQEGFSIWDLLDIGRQVSSALDHAHSKRVFHFSLEPAKVMCGWDGTVRVLGFGVSSAGKFTAQLPGVPAILPYMSPEQVRGEIIDARSNLYSLGTLFYEMVTDRKAFDHEDPELLRQSILQSTPATPISVNPKLHPLLSDLIMKALAKNPDERYQSGRELLDDLEKCKESKQTPTKAAAASAKAAAVVAPAAASSAKFASAAPAAAQQRPLEKKPAAPQAPVVKTTPAPTVYAKSVAAPDVAGASAVVRGPETLPRSNQNINVQRSPNSPSAQPNPAPVIRAQPPVAKSTAQAAVSSAVLNEPLLETFSVQQVGSGQAGLEPAETGHPKLAVDPMMAESTASRGNSISFSEMTELPPLKEIHIAPPAPSPAFDQQPLISNNFNSNADAETQKFQPREMAEKAITEIKNVPPRLMIYSVAGAAVLISIIAAGLVLHINHLNNDEDPVKPTAELASPYSDNQPAAAQTAQAEAQSIAPAQSQAVESQAVEPQVAESRPRTAHAAAGSRGKNSRKKIVAPVASVVVPGQMAVDSTPQGAQVQIDGKTDPSWITPFTLPSLDAGQHTVTITKPGYAADTRAVEVNSGAKSFVVTHLTQLTATLSVTSTPPGANVYIDGKDTGKLTPAQVSIDKGQHVVLVRKPGFIDETTSAQFVLAQTVSFSPTLRALGNVDDLKTLGKMKKLFGGKEAQGRGTIIVRTQPRGAQVAVNQHMLDQSSPVDFMLDPGNYEVDITMIGYTPVHKIITVDKGGKAVIDQVLQHD
jgi:serine/threonine-protein kinase